MAGSDGFGDERPRVEWDDIRTGVPCSFVVWRGQGGRPGVLNDHWRKWIGRDLLLGPGAYACPSKHVASKYGAPVRCLATLDNPYVVRCPKRERYGSYMGPVKDLDLEAIRAAHDGIVLIEAVSEWREDLRQLLVFPEHAHKLVVGWREPRAPRAARVPEEPETEAPPPFRR